MPRFTYSYDVHNTVYVRKTVAFYMYQEIILCNESICCSVLAATKCVTNVSFPVNPPPREICATGRSSRSANTGVPYVSSVREKLSPVKFILAVSHVFPPHEKHPPPREKLPPPEKPPPSRGIYDCGSGRQQRCSMCFLLSEKLFTLTFCGCGGRSHVASIDAPQLLKIYSCYTVCVRSLRAICQR